jgi:hypothetical protein
MIVDSHKSCGGSNMNNNYLSEEEQYKDILNNEEISRIKDLELRNIRTKYWHLKHQVFLDEVNISDSMLESKYNNIMTEEKKEIEEYKKRKRNHEDRCV